MIRSVDIRWARIRIGVFFAVTLLVLGIGIFYVGEETRLFSKTVEVAVILPEVQGLRVGAPVWLSGVVIGTVANIAFTEALRSDEVTITLKIDENAAARLGSDAKVSLRTQGLLGSKYVDITPGRGWGLPDGPLHGAPAVEVDQVMRRAYAAFERLEGIFEGVDVRRGSLGKLMTDPSFYDSLMRVSLGLEQIVGKIVKEDGGLGRMLADPKFYDEMVAFSSKGIDTFGRLESLLMKLEKGEGSAARFVNDPALYEEGVMTLRETRTSFEEMRKILSALRNGEGTAGKLLVDPNLHDRMAKTLAELDALLKDIRENPKKYFEFSVF